jgi:hypothetical protein
MAQRDCSWRGEMRARRASGCGDACGSARRRRARYHRKNSARFPHPSPRQGRFRVSFRPFCWWSLHRLPFLRARLPHGTFAQVVSVPSSFPEHRSQIPLAEFHSNAGHFSRPSSSCAAGLRVSLFEPLVPQISAHHPHAPGSTDLSGCLADNHETMTPLPDGAKRTISGTVTRDDRYRGWEDR